MLLSAAVIILCVIAEHSCRYIFRELTEITYNPGAAFGIFGSVPGFALWLSLGAFIAISGVIALADIKRPARIGLAFMAGGALSNLLERIFIGYVIDWIPVPFMDLYFNLADVEISIGALIAFISLL